jgi:tryptophan 2,3-dioxygenase
MTAAATTRLGIDPFPFRDVLDQIHRTGKHFMPHDLVVDLIDARQRVLASPRPNALLAAWLDCVLDKHDLKYDYRTYLALPLLPLPGTADAVPGLRRDELLLWLIADVAAFEVTAAAGSRMDFPGLRPPRRTSEKRVRLALRALAGPARRVLGFDGVGRDDAETVGELAVAAADRFTPTQVLGLQLAMVPVFTVHDEYMFIRILQAYECVFTDLALRLAAVVAAVDARDAVDARQHLVAASAALDEAAPLFSLLATMQVEAFQAFRQFTEGASAIQSDAAKLVESLCATPTPARLDGPAFQSVPTVRRRVLDRQRTIADAMADAAADGASSSALAEVREGMDAFATSLTRWRTTHHSLARHMLGEDTTGTGYTSGVAYLQQVRGLPVFPAPREGDDQTPSVDPDRPTSGLTWSGESE